MEACGAASCTRANAEVKCVQAFDCSRKVKVRVGCFLLIKKVKKQKTKQKKNNNNTEKKIQNKTNVIAN